MKAEASASRVTSARSVSVLGQFWGSTIGKKVVMAVTGALMVAFVIGHMAGNLKVFGGFDPLSGLYKIDAYGEFLRSMGEDVLGKYGFLWLTRIGLLVSVLLHIFAAVSLRQQNQAARPVGYRRTSYSSSTVASRTMAYGGMVLLLFIVVHILHFTTGHLHFEGFEYGKVYANLHASFSQWYWVLFYSVAMGALALHLFHGAWSLFQTLGIDTPRWNSTIRSAALAVSVLVAAGFVATPWAIYLKALPVPTKQRPPTAFASLAEQEQLVKQSARDSAAQLDLHAARQIPDSSSSSEGKPY